MISQGLIFIFQQLQMNATVKCKINEGVAEFLFQQPNRKLTSEVDAIVEVLQRKCQEDFTNLRISFEKGQSVQREIGEVLKGLKNKLTLENISVNIGDSNKLEDKFVTNLAVLIRNNKQTLKRLSLTIGKSCLQVDILFTLLKFINQCQVLQSFKLKIESKNNQNRYSQPLQAIGICLKQFKLDIVLQDARNINRLDDLFEQSKEMFINLLTLKLDIRIQQTTLLNPKIRTDFINCCHQLKQLSLSISSNYLEIKQNFLTSICKINSLRLRITQIDLKQQVNPFQCISNYTSLQHLSISFQKCIWPQQSIDLTKILGCLLKLKTLQLIFQINSITSELLNQIFLIEAGKIHLQFFIVAQYKELYSYSLMVLECPKLPAELVLSLQNKIVTLDVSILNGRFRMKVLENIDHCSKHHTQFAEVAIFQQLSDKLQLHQIYDSEIQIQPSIYSNYSRYKKQMYTKLFQIHLRYLKVKISNEFEMGYNSLLINIDDNSIDFLLSVLNFIRYSNTNKVIIYHSQVNVQDIYQKIMQLYAYKIFLTFENYFMYSESRKIHYQRLLKPMAARSEAYSIYIAQIYKIHERLKKKMRFCYIFDIIEKLFGLE